ncbi:hypothetical protein L0Z64_19295 (plasmid) [Phaeobacter sp. BS23]|uniref:hypothetical protein n=1 Tax=Phaeobacter sp. BS23 TaxID=2907239 RepID=UPI003703ABCC
MKPISNTRLDVLRTQDPALADLLEICADQPVGTYFDKIARPEHGKCHTAIDLRAQLLSILLHTDRSGVASNLQMQQLTALDDCVGIHTGSHCQSFFEPSVFRSFLSAQQIALVAPKRPVIAWMSAIVRLENARKWGPGWLTGAATPFNIFDLSRRVLAANSPLMPVSRDKLASLVHRQSDGRDTPEQDWIRIMARLAAEQLRSDAATPVCFADLLLAWNAKAFEDGVFGTVPFILFDERAIAELLAELLQSGQSALNALFFDPFTRSDILQGAASFCSQPGFRWSTDLLWENRDGRIRALKSDGLDFVNDQKERLAVETIITELRAHRLLPGLFVCYLILAILPGLRAFGGSLQVAYFPDFIRLARRLDIDTTLDLPQAITTQLLEQGLRKLKTWEPCALMREAEKFHYLSLETASSCFRCLPDPSRQ